MCAVLRIFLSGLLLALPGCSTLRLAYDNADIWLRWRGAHYLDLHGPELDRRIAEFMAWHRKDALPRYARFLEEAARRMGGGLSREDLVWGYDSVRAQLGHDLQIAAAGLVEVLEALEPDQIENLERRFAEDNRKYARQFLSGSAERRRARRAERNAERFEEWFGRLSDAQLERVRQHSEEQPLIEELRDRERRRVQAELLAMLRSREVRGRLGAWSAQLVPGGGEPKYAAAMKPYIHSYFDLVIELDRLASPRQRQHAIGKLQRYASDFGQLAQAER